MMAMKTGCFAAFFNPPGFNEDEPIDVTRKRFFATKEDALVQPHKPFLFSRNHMSKICELYTKFLGSMPHVAKELELDALEKKDFEEAYGVSKHAGVLRQGVWGAPRLTVTCRSPPLPSPPPPCAGGRGD